MSEPTGDFATRVLQIVPTATETRLTERERIDKQSRELFYETMHAAVMETVEGSAVVLEDESCYICLADYYSWHGADRVCDDVPMRLIPCGHIFGRMCIKEWLGPGTGKNTCPLCRVVLFPLTFQVSRPQFDQASVASIASSSMIVATGRTDSEPTSEASQGTGPELIRVDPLRLLRALRDTMQWAMVRADQSGVNCDLLRVTSDLQAAAIRLQGCRVSRRVLNYELTWAVLRTIIIRREFPPDSAAGALQRREVMQRHYGRYIIQRRREDQQESQQPRRGLRGRLQRLVGRTKRRFGCGKGRWPSFEMKELVEEIVAHMVASQRSV
ncbi:hypothetical protein K490DRAFT_61863 [Saccharata proteae CBS 121410]|uniref:RING-type domain-containing protein n=1 Tax=Saccharata proteae CBS 121410 TaxID=1314787 RepID=A0A9P4I0Z1_9PEZI|nr:hypothetical protein K490DRAFT_61863 [Saccharata proteae CBS 121410]